MRFKKLFGRVAICLGAGLALHAAAESRPKIIAHRGLSQQFDHAGIDRFSTCTATRIAKPVHPYIENTIASMKAAFRLGAAMVEIDVAPTADGQVVVFHDWTLDCRTDGQGEVRARTLAELKALDIGYGYTADGGRTFPFRGKGVGPMPTLEEVLRALPGRRLLINFKSKDPNEADAVAAAFGRAKVAIDGRYAFYGPGADKVLARMRALAPKAWVWDRAEACSRAYLAQGWTPATQGVCHGEMIVVPLDWTARAEGWPDLFLERMRANGTRVLLTGDMGAGTSPGGIERREQLKRVPKGFNGYLWVEDLWALTRAPRR
jgi:glycerophosphoryl diester phosphodiesterase